ncbi:hypothetical protein K9L05_02675 [Candidatus Babeliales bacterium]|nr:hypothetical protein [Candidatus Babeliales bacterium]MCF7899531.1 hypothetical protein [Candidatus Babeliales bacterium]
MKKIIYMLFFCFCIQISYCKNNKIEQQNFEFDKQEEKKIFSLLKNIFYLDYRFSLNNLSDTEKQDLISKSKIIINDLLDLLKIENITVSGKKFNYFYLLKKTNTKEERDLLIENFFQSKDEKKMKDFFGEIFIILDSYLKSKIKNILFIFKYNLKEFFKNKKNVYDSEENCELYRLGKKESMIIAAIFGAIANIFTSSNHGNQSNNNQDTSNSTLPLVGSACDLISQLAAINAAHKKSKSNDLIKNRQFDEVLDETVKFIDILCISLKEKNINLKNYELLDEFSKLKLEQNKKSWLYEKLISNQLFKKLIKNIFKALKIYLTDQLSHALNYLRDKLIELLININTEKEEDYEPWHAGIRTKSKLLLQS